MMIVDAQSNLWANGIPRAHHRPEPYSKDQALAAASFPPVVGHHPGFRLIVDPSGG